MTRQEKAKRVARRLNRCLRNFNSEIQKPLTDEEWRPLNRKLGLLRRAFMRLNDVIEGRSL